MSQETILIGSSPSSGSTLLSILLDSHPQIFCGPELAFFSHPLMYNSWKEFQKLLTNYIFSGVYSRSPFQERLEKGFCPYSVLYQDNLEYYNHDVDSFLKLVNSSEDLDSFIFNFTQPLLEKYSKSIWAEKTPTNLYAFSTYLKKETNGKVIYLIRDGRDVVCSLLKRNYSFSNAALIWLVESSWCAHLIQHPRFKLVRYEDLVYNPRITLQELTEFLDIDLAVDEMLSTSGKSLRVNNDPSIHRMTSWRNQPHKKISSSSVGRWKSELNSEQLDVFSCLHLNSLKDNQEEHNISIDLSLLAGYTFNEVLSFYKYETAPIKDINIKYKDISVLCGYIENILGEITFHSRHVNITLSRLDLPQQWHDSLQRKILLRFKEIYAQQYTLQQDLCTFQQDLRALQQDLRVLQQDLISIYKAQDKLE